MGGGGREAEEGGYMDIYIHIYITDSLCCTAETNTNYKATMHACMLSRFSCVQLFATI